MGNIFLCVFKNAIKFIYQNDMFYELLSYFFIKN